MVLYLYSAVFNDYHIDWLFEFDVLDCLENFKRKFIEILNSKDKIDTTRSVEKLHKKKFIWEVSVLETEGDKR